MTFELHVALRYLVGKRKQTFISVISVISVLGVCLGVASLIIVLAVMNGFTTNMRDKLLGVNAHVILSQMGGGIADYASLAETVNTMDGVEGATPFIYSEVMLSTPAGVKGVVLYGIDPASADSVLSIARTLHSAKLADLNGSDPFPKIFVGRKLADRLGLVKGSKVSLLSPAGARSAAGYAPKVRMFEVAGLFHTGMIEYDSSLAYVDMAAAADLLGFREVRASGLEIRTNDVDRADVIGARVVDALGGTPYYARDWKQMNENLFAALRLEKTAMFVILVMIVLVASFSIVTTLVMLVMEKTQDIAILMSMGATRASIRTIFMLQGMIIGAAGTALGYALGISSCLLLRQYQFIKLPEDVYMLDHLPILFNWVDMTMVGASALALCFLATLYPARQAARLEPAEALRYE
ncbi:MAG: lipoprotein-releasing ABC transporter permease subunit [Desulfovibrionaceae bacterium]